MVLLSDGNETRGSAAAQMARARTRQRQHLRQRCRRTIGWRDVSVEKLAVAPLIAEGSVFPVRVILRNQAKARPVELSLLIDGEPVGRESITLQPGLNAVEIPYRMSGPGSHRLRAQILAVGDAIAGNNYREATLMIGGKSRVLLVTTQPRSPLANVLQRKDFSVTTASPTDFPTQVDGLLGYHCVIFEDVTAANLNARRLEALERYVKDFGGGFIVAAGERTYGDTGFKKTAFERMLPVTLEPRRPPRAEREPLALFILIDRSNSMGYHITQAHWSAARTSRSWPTPSGPHSRWCSSSRTPTWSGLIVFDSQPFEVSPLRPLKENRATLLRRHPAPATGRRHRFLRRAGVGARAAGRLARRHQARHLADRRRHQSRRRRPLSADRRPGEGATSASRRFASATTPST